jgi:aspartyl-tRNA(Asn)/glutamyl-tRNA(Gln) amidotransferase subunit A
MTTRTSSRSVVDAALERAADIAGEGCRVFISLDVEGARKAADAVDRQSAPVSPIAGLPVSIKDLLDVEGQVTTAASTAFRNAPPAARDSAVVSRLKRAGAVLVGRTNMTEFAFTGVGMNPHYGTPANPFDRAARRIPGGSSSGAAVSVTDGMCAAAIGSDTGGSVRIPAALCGIVGFKPTQYRVPLNGVFPLSPTLDSIGVLAPTVGLCAAFDAVLADEESAGLPGIDLRTLRAGVPTNDLLDDLEPAVALAFERALAALSAAGLPLADTALPEVAEIARINARGGFSAAESYAWHRDHGTDVAASDPRVTERMLRGASISTEDLARMHTTRREIIHRFDAAQAAIDVILCPTVPIIAPPIRTLEEDPAEFRRVNALLLRNPSVVNFLDRCALTIPCHHPGEAPVGLMLIGRHGQDRMLLAIGAAIERVLQTEV